MALRRWLAGLLTFAATGWAGAVEIRHALWDSAQRPMYAQCARDFERAHPGIRIRITQLGWDDYWTSLATGFVADTAPDVFANHLARIGDQVPNGVLVDLAPLIARDRVDVGLYEPGLLENWRQGAAQYGLPADWDTVALAVNLDAARRASVSLAELRTLDWNPRDGGSFGRVAARLARDRQGRNALDPAFDRSQVEVYGYQTGGPGGMFGQTEWSHFAVSNGFRYQDAPWRGPLRYDDPALIETIAWLATLPGRGISAELSAIGRIGADAMFTSGRVAMVAVGSWMAGYIRRQARFEAAFVPLPVGPTGQRATLRNGIAHSIWRGSRHVPEAWLWLRHLGSPACQQVVARQGLVYPAVRGLGAVAADVQRQRGIEPGAFVDLSGTRSFGPPVVDHGARINDLIHSAIESSLLGRASPARALPAANAQANAVLAR